MPGYLLEHFLKNYQGKGIFFLKWQEIKIMLKDLTLISGIKVTNIDFKSL